MGESLVREGYEGTGPGAITPDGCAVELYRRLSVGDEPDVIAGVAAAGANILELGCGAGRVTHPLVRRGFSVTAVDESQEMLDEIVGARRVRSPIESLDLGGERFDVVLLGSFLVHAGEHRVRDGMLRVCRDHVRDDGIVLVQREGTAHRSELPWERTDPSGGLIRIVSADPVGDGVRSVRAEYHFDDAQWTQTFLSRELSDEDIARHLTTAGLAWDRTLTDDGTWLLARPVL
ncbi:class I SAM-dependent methyltransferase [Streptomyces anulatus]|uniref:class I SAM-dependent methyltransferase n=1 Tax=Streptomyces anulatus TaxID=1892 RepID=UPI001C266965|nr:class I SAM-dependent methyltransferase [Streptomyces anulatus]